MIYYVRKLQKGTRGPPNAFAPRTNPHPKYGEVVALEVEAGDLARVPAGTWHWFDLCQDKRIRAIRLFQDPTGWTPHYTESGVDESYMPVCFGLTFIPAQLQSL